MSKSFVWYAAAAVAAFYGYPQLAFSLATQGADPSECERRAAQVAALRANADAERAA